MWFIYALLGAIITGIGQVFVKKGQAKLTPLIDNLMATIIVNVILVPLLFLRGVNIEAGKNILIYALIAATLYATFYYIISLAHVSLMVSLINTFPVVTIILAIIYLHELPNVYQLFGIIIIILGTVFLSRRKVDDITNKKKLWIFWGLLGSIAIGSAEFITKLATLRVDGFTFTFFVYLMYIPPLIIFMIFDKKGRKFENLKNKLIFFYTTTGILFIESGLIAIALAYQHGPASLVSPVVATHMLITAVLAWFFLRENLSTFQRIGILINLVGISIIGIYS